jgi:transcription elongation factor GreA
VVLLAIVDILEEPPRDTHRKRALALLSTRGTLVARIAASPVPEEASRKITTRLKGWRASDKFRFPLLDYLRVTGHNYVADEVEGHRARSVARIGARSEESPADPYDGDLVLTRASLERMERERVRIGMELKTTIPQTIQRARELGDLSENAEYHAAKAKQAEYAQRFQDLETAMKRVRLIEDLPRPEGVALPGTEVELAPVDTGESYTVWMLGEGDQDLDETVVSYKAPIGAALHGKSAGDVVELPGEAGPRAYRVVRVRERLT